MFIAQTIKAVAGVLLLAISTGSPTVGLGAENDAIVGPREDRAALAAVVDELCGREVALLGEALHDGGHTDTFKAALVQQLVTKCGFKAVFFEGSYYEFQALARARREGKVVTSDMVGSAVGGLWKFDREFQPLLPFLADGVMSGRLTLGGIDFQTGGFDQPYSNDVMPAELAGYLHGNRVAQCREATKRRIYDGYASARQAELLQCVADISSAITSRRDINAKLREQQNGMLANLKAYFAVDPSDTPSLIRARDRAMFDNFRSLKNGLPQRAKVIVWGATSHMAKDATADPDFATVKNFGSYMHRAYGGRAFSIGFTAFSGSYKWGRETRAIQSPPVNSLEAHAMTGGGSDTVYLGPKRLEQLGVVQSAAFRRQYRTTNWAKALDGIVVLHTEYPPHDTRPG